MSDISGQMDAALAGGGGGGEDSPQFEIYEERLLGDSDPAADRTLSPDDEDCMRRRRLARLGLLLLIGFAMPVSTLSEPIQFPQFTQFFGWSLASLALYLPAIAGLLTFAAARWAPTPWRGIALLAAGVSPVAMLLTIDGSPALFADSLTRMPTDFLLSISLWITAAMLLLVTNRVRRYRPIRQSSFLLGLFALPCYLVHLAMPVMGNVPLLDIGSMLEQQPSMAIGWGLHILLMLAACIVTLRNTPSQPPRNAARRASLAYWLLLLSAASLLIAVLVAVGFDVMRGAAQGADANTLALMAIATVKMTVTMAGFLLLVPAAIADLWIGRS
ncbi:MAG: hypothetical protein AB8H80_01565 [Planctomycetota bacterium]